MSLPRKSVHVKLQHDVHADLLQLCNIDNILPAHWIERLVENELAREFTRAASLRREREARIKPAKGGEVRVSQLSDFPTLIPDKSYQK